MLLVLLYLNWSGTHGFIESDESSTCCVTGKPGKNVIPTFYEYKKVLSTSITLRTGTLFEVQTNIVSKFKRKYKVNTCICS